MSNQDQKKVPLEKKPVGGVPTVQETAPDTAGLVNKIDAVLGGKIRVTHGANDCEFENLVGKSVASVRKSLGSVFSIPKDAQAYIRGEVVDETYKLKENDQLEFLKQSGTKG
jgi:hypothetical protein